MQRREELYHYRRHEGTGTWILRESALQRWFDKVRCKENFLLTLRGDVAAGKRICW